MITIKFLRFLLPVAFLTILLQRTHGQNIDEKTYQHKMQLLDSLSMDKMQDFDTLYHVSVLYNFGGKDYPQDYDGWIKKRNKTDISFLDIHGNEFELEKKKFTSIAALPIDNSIVERFTKKDKNDFVTDFRSFASDYLLALWLYKKGSYDYSKRLLPENDKLFDDNNLRDDFGILYYDAMLSAFSGARDYPEAISYGEHLSRNIFKGYKYQPEAIALTAQLKNNAGDFKAFRLPDSTEWLQLKQKLNRQQQILYLADRLRLLNCIQSGQPGDIGYNMYQYSVSFAQANKLGFSYWDHNAKYEVVNPFIELIAMKLSPAETKLLLPYLLSNDYIASYSYFRNFRPQRTLHKVSWVVDDLLYQITDQLFLRPNTFDPLPLEQKKVEVEKIKKWCDDNAGISKEDRTIKILKTTNDWTDFDKAIKTAKDEKYSALLPIIVARFNDFKGGMWPTNRGILAKTMFELGDAQYISAVRQWSKDTTDTWVNLWASLFLLKYDRESYAPAMNELKFVLKKCDGTSYYPYAMDFLLSTNDKSELKLAEGILDKPRFQSMMDWPSNLNFIKKLLLLKSDYTYHFLSEKLAVFSPEETESFNKNDGNKNMLVESDYFVLTVDQIRGSKPGYDAGGGLKARLEYKKALSKWFDTQYILLKSGKPNELLLTIQPVEIPVETIDSPRD